MEEKKCNKCNIIKDIEYFYKRDSSKDGYRNECKSCLSKRKKERYKINKKEIAIKRKIYYYKNQEKTLLQKSKYGKDNREKINKYRRYYINKRKSEDILFTLKCRIRGNILKALKNKGYSKKSKAHEILGCSFIKFEKHLNNNLYGFKTGDLNLDLDHIIPLSNVNSEESIIELSHYTNYQLLPSVYNRDIKSDNPWNQTHFEEWLLKNPQNSAL